MRNLKSWFLVLVLIATGVASAAPTAAPVSATVPRDTTLTVWGFVWTADWLESIAPGFEAAHPGVKVNVERFEYEVYRDAIIAALASGTDVPNVVTLDPMWAGDLIRNGAVMPLDGIEDQLNPADFVGGWELCQDEGTQYGVPADLDFNIMFYRKDLYDPAIAEAGLDTFPTNTEDFIKVSKLISNEDTKAILLAQSDYYAWYQGFLVPYGGRLFSDGEYAFASDAGVDALTLYNRLVEEGVALLWDETAEGNPMPALTNGDVLAIMHGSWYVTELETAAPEMKGQWGVAPMPFGPTDRQYHAATGGSCFSIPVAATDQDLATEFLVYMEQPEVMATYYTVVGGVPALKTAWDYLDLEAVNDYLGVPLAKLVTEWAPGTVGMELPGNEMSTAIADAIYAVTAEGVDPREALETAVELSPELE